MPSTIITTGSSFSNSYLLKGARTAIIDTGILGQDKKILATLEANGIARDNVSLIILTHGHGDHYGTLKKLKDAIDVPVMAGWPDAGYIEKGDSAPVVPVNMTGRVMKLFTGAKADPCKVDVIVKNDMDLNDYGLDARVLMTPGHTMGSLSILASDGGCAIGDLLGSIVFKDNIGRAPFAEAPDMIGASLKKVLDSGAKYLYPGHGNRWDASAMRQKFSSIIP